MFIAGQRTWSNSAATFDAIDPATAEVFATVASGDKSDIDAAIAAARAAFEGGWAGLPPVRRVRILNQMAGLLRERRAGGAAPGSLAGGEKPLPARGNGAAAPRGF